MAKGRVFLFLWNKAEAEAVAQALRKEGWAVDLEWEDGARGGAAVKQNPPDAAVFYLTRLPSHSRATAEYLAQTGSTRQIPLIFVGGEAEALEKIKGKIPSGIYVQPEGLSRALGKIAKGVRDSGAVPSSGGGP